MKERLAVVALCILVAMEYGVLHDLVTTQLSIKYFTVGHLPPFWLPCDAPNLAVFYGITSSWWLGLIFGVLLSGPAATKIGIKRIFLMLQRLCLVGFAFAVLGGVTSGVLASLGLLELPTTVRERILAENQIFWFLVVAGAHLASYIYWVSVGGVFVYGIKAKPEWIEFFEATRVSRAESNPRRVESSGTETPSDEPSGLGHGEGPCPPKAL